MLIFRIKQKIYFFVENYFFFIKNIFKKDIYFAIAYFKINIYLKKTDWVNLKKKLNEIYNKGYLRIIELSLLKNNFKIDKYYYYPEINILYFYYRFFKNFNKTFKLKLLLLNNNYITKKNFELVKNFELQNSSIKEMKNHFKINLKNDLKNNQNRIFYKYLRGKKIALVGPNLSNKLLGEEIDNYDIVIRTNFRENSNVPHSVYGTKTNIAYYNSFRVANMSQEIKSSQPFLDWIIFKSENDIRKLNLDFLKVNLRVSINPSRLFLYSSPMSPQRIIYDILSYQPEYLKIFHFDLYNSGSYNKNYKNWDLNKSAISNSLREHGAYSCFVFMKNLFELNFFEADKDTANVFKQTLSEYSINLDKNYGKIEHF